MPDPKVPALNMRQLLLLRHAKSSWDDPSHSDHARRLNPRGHAAASAMRTAMRQFGLAPEVVLVSSARRTLQTLDALGPWDRTPAVEPMDGLYLASPERILTIVAAVSDTVRSLMVVGHNPGLHDLAMRLAGAHDASSDGNLVQQLGAGFPAGALAEFTVTPAWRNLGGETGDGPAGRLVRFIRPRDLEADGQGRAS